MFRPFQFVNSCFAAVALGSTAIGAETAEINRISDLAPFSYRVYIPVGAGLPSIKFESIKAVKVPTKLRTVTNLRDCEQPFAEPGGSMNCPRTTSESPVPAY